MPANTATPIAWRISAPAPVEVTSGIGDTVAAAVDDIGDAIAQVRTLTDPRDIALLCATHRQLGERVKAGRFREDLYYRVNGLSVQLPPLRARAGRHGEEQVFGHGHVGKQQGVLEQQADMALVLKPGTDGALACAVMHVAFRDGYADRAYMEKFADDPGGLEAHLASRTPEWAAAITVLRSLKSKPSPPS